MLLAIDTSTRQLSIALATENQIIAESTWISQNHHNRQLAIAIETLFAQSETDANDLTGVAVAQGPGSYTGVRIGLALAKGIAHAKQIPLYPVPTLAIVAHGTPPTDMPLLAVIPAGRKRVLAAYYTLHDEKWQPTSEIILQPWQELLDGITTDVLLNGEISETGRQMIDTTNKPIHLLSIGQQVRRAAFLAEYAMQLSPQPPEHVQPLYAKQP